MREREEERKKKRRRRSGTRTRSRGREVWMTSARLGLRPSLVALRSKRAQVGGRSPGQPGKEVGCCETEKLPRVITRLFRGGRQKNGWRSGYGMRPTRWFAPRHRKARPRARVCSNKPSARECCVTTAEAKCVKYCARQRAESFFLLRRGKQEERWGKAARQRGKGVVIEEVHHFPSLEPTIGAEVRDGRLCNVLRRVFERDWFVIISVIIHDFCMA